MSRTSTDALADRLTVLLETDRIVEVGIGRRTDVAHALADRGLTVIATDVHPRAVPEGIEFVIDDVTDPTRSVYEGAGVIYALNLPPELHRPALALAREVGADLRFTTLGGDEPAISVERTSLAGETLYAPRTRGP